MIRVGGNSSARFKYRAAQVLSYQLRFRALSVGSGVLAPAASQVAPRLGGPLRLLRGDLQLRAPGRIETDSFAAVPGERRQIENGKADLCLVAGVTRAEPASAPHDHVEPEQRRRGVGETDPPALWVDRPASGGACSTCSRIAA
jgi:hypothetical protein